MKKDEHNEVELIIETGAEPEKSGPVASAGDAAVERENVVEKEKNARPESESSAALKRIKESASEDDNAPVGSLSLKQIVGGDYLFALVRHHILLILFIVFFLVFYVGVRYQCEQDVIEINQLEKDLVDAKYKALSSSSNLTELCRQSNVLKALHEYQDSLLQLSDQPPYIIEVPEE
jgi:hypothetical protein